MSMTDPISDMLARIRNGIASRKARITLPSSRLKQDVAKILQEEGFVGEVKLDKQPVTSLLEIELKWARDNRNAIEGIRRVSTPGQRVYVGKGDIQKVRSGLGISILTTSQGVMSDRQARKLAIGGEVLCEVW